ncbi:MAG: bacillithiol biosynthesis cysteine-adding enzyme BshC [Bacteroidota bacterium]|nr:bacillithiol biosynthesis cysteine-adding enzyme BshC [Bacteroidota bacterium]
MPKTFQSTYLPYSETNSFTKIVLDYLKEADDLKEFYTHNVSLEGIKASINQRKNFNTDRQLLTEQLHIQYEKISDNDLVKVNIDRLSEENTFTLCTAHQPNIFTGHLYFIYKILHTIKLAEELTEQLPGYNFVPVYFMGSEDADLDELDHVVIDGKKYKWQTKQIGAVGRMKVDDKLINLIDEISGRLSVEKYGKEIIDVLKEYFKKDYTIEHATFLLVHHLFKTYGLIVLLPDKAAYKKAMHSIFEDDLFNNKPSEIVSETSKKLSEKYKVQAHPREINLFYLKDNIRNRIVEVKDKFVVHETELVFTKDELQKELEEHPEYFSPNVILRGLLQEIILPNIAFIGGGGELAYWLELKDLFLYYEVPFPVLILRNSFLLIEKKYQQLIQKLELTSVDLFKVEQLLMNQIVLERSKQKLNIDEEKSRIELVYNEIKKVAKEIDPTLHQHTEALQTKALKALAALEKKMLRAEKRKFEDTKNQLDKILDSLFPGGNLQERTENFMLFYAKFGSDFLNELYKNSLTLSQEFCVLEENG